MLAARTGDVASLKALHHRRLQCQRARDPHRNHGGDLGGDRQSRRRGPGAGRGRRRSQRAVEGHRLSAHAGRRAAQRSRRRRARTSVRRCCLAAAGRRRCTRRAKGAVDAARALGRHRARTSTSPIPKAPRRSSSRSSTATTTSPRCCIEKGADPEHRRHQGHDAALCGG